MVETRLALFILLLGVSQQNCLGQSSPTTLSAGVFHVCAVTPGHRVVCWGLNQHGQLGTTTSQQSLSVPPSPISTTPVVVPGVRGAVSVAAAFSYSCALLDSGKVVCWGGDSTSVREVQGVSGVSALLVGNLGPTNLFCGLLSPGYVCWTGDGANLVQRNTPIRALGFAVVAGSVFGGIAPCEISQGTTARCLVGNNQSTSINAPGQIVQVAPFSGGYCTLLNGGSVFCNRPPGAVIPGFSRIQDLRCSGAFRCLGLDEDGAVTELRLHGNPLSPSTGQISGLFDVVEVSISDDFGCAKKSSGSVFCYGSNADGQLGRGGNITHTNDGDLPLGLVVGFP